MLKFDFKTYMSSFLDDKLYDDLLKKKNSILEHFTNDSMTGWYQKSVDDTTLRKIKKVSQMIREKADVLLVIGIGGSYMGSYSIAKIFTNEFVKDDVEVIYIGNNLSAKKLSEVVNYIKDKSVYVNVISKSGTTLEIKLTYNYILNILKEKYDLAELKERIIVTTNQLSGYLKDEASKYGFMTFDMPSDIGGRYSIITPAHLLVLAVMNLDIDKFLKGYYEGKKYLDEAYNYACIRNVMYKLGFLLENFSVYHESLYYYTEFLKQLFGESEGKDGKGIFPVSTVNTRDLHSLGQFIQEGKKVIYETVIKANYQTDVMMNDKSLNEYNDIVLNSVVEAHYDGGVPNNIIDMGIISLESVGQLTMFFMMASAFSAYLFDVDPFNQPGVEKYKNIMNSKISNF